MGLAPKGSIVPHITARHESALTAGFNAKTPGFRYSNEKVRPRPISLSALATAVAVLTTSADGASAFLRRPTTNLDRALSGSNWTYILGDFPGER
jgi:hypothetical protein